MNPEPLIRGEVRTLVPIGDGTGGAHGPSLPFYFRGACPPIFLPKYRKFK